MKYILVPLIYLMMPFAIIVQAFHVAMAYIEDKIKDQL
tara:strand:+ start:2934 stop:3047 length:114 start_codon:yes stop_codon:yes gene_type:complete